MIKGYADADCGNQERLILAFTDSKVLNLLNARN